MGEFITFDHLIPFMHWKYKFLLIVLFCVNFYSCKEEKVKVKDPTAATDTLKIHFRDSLRTKTLLPSNVQNTAQQMPGYPVLQKGLADLQGETLGNVKTQTEEWVTAAKELRLALLDSVSNRAINSRMTLLVTKASILKQEVEKRNVDTATINTEATEFYNAFQDLAMQLNLEYGRSVDDFLKDFKEESQKLRNDARKRKSLENNQDNDQ
ncbi:MAG TPA: hypothetical protein ENH91_15385 [Leeuwenhoekiella sp.]|nr:hypothetical protein [Leeuwenhoekiella sp.]